MRFYKIPILFVIMYCSSCLNNKEDNDYSKFNIENKSNFNEFDKLFECLNTDTLIISNVNMANTICFFGPKIDTTLYNLFLSKHILKNIDDNYMAVFKYELNDSLTTYIIRHDLYKVNLLVYDKKSKKYLFDNELANYSGDEGYEAFKNSKVFFLNKIVKINTNYYETFEKKIEFDSTYIIEFKF
jgi:hypothetical protein